MSLAKCEVVPVFPSPRVCAVHTINDRVYTVYSTGVYSGRDEIVSFSKKIVDSTLCGQALALFLIDSTLIVLSPRTLADEQYWGVEAEYASVSTGISHYCETLRSGTQMVSADYSGQLIAVHLGSHYVATYLYLAAYNQIDYDGTATFDTNLAEFQVVTVGPKAYLWTVTWEEQHSHRMLGLVELGTVGSTRGAPRQVCRFPVSIPLGPSEDSARVELLPADEGEGGLFIYRGQCLFYITVSSAVVGDFRPMMQAALTEVKDLFFTQHRSGSRTVYVAHLDGYVYELLIEPKQKRLGLSLQPVTEIPRQIAETTSRWFHALPADSELLCVPRGGTRITQCELDKRKWPWRTLVLSGSHLTALAPVTAVEYTEKMALNNLDSVLMITQVPRLKTLFISTISGTGWLAPNEIAFDGLKDKSLLAAGIMSNSLVFVFAKHVELRSIFAPFILMDSWHVDADELILSSSIGADYCLVQMLDRVIMVKANNTSLETKVLLSGLTISFVRCDEGRSHIGVALINEADQSALRNKLSNFITTDSYLMRPTSVAGATLSIDPSLRDPAEVRYHGYLPTDLITLRDGISVVLYGVDGKVLLIPPLANAPTLYNVLSTVRIAGRLGDSRQAVILYGRGGLWEVTEKGCRMIYDRRSRKWGDAIEQACTLEDGNIAVVKKGELRFLQSPRSYGNQLPAQLQTVSNLAKNTRMLLIPSKRMILVHGGSVCTFMDSASFELLTVSGLRAQNCDQVTLWQFGLQGEPYEHLVFANGKGAIESYAVHRDHKQVTLECKLRFLVSLDNTSNVRAPEALHCQGDFVYLGRYDQLFKACPKERKRCGTLYCGATVRYVSQIDNVLIVSTERSVGVVDAAEFRTFRDIPTGKKNVGHAAGYVKIGGEKLLHILCAREKESFILLVYDPVKRTLVQQYLRLEGFSDREQRIRSLSQAPTQLDDNGFSVVAVMDDYSIKNIAVSGPNEKFGMNAVVEMTV